MDSARVVGRHLNQFWFNNKYLGKPQYKTKFFLSPTLAAQEVHLSHAGGQHQQFSTTNHYAHIRKKKFKQYFYLPFTEWGKLLL